MSSPKVLICDLCVLLLFSAAILAEDKSSTTGVDARPKGNCSCGGFTTCTPEAGSAPLLSQMPGLVMTCDEEGATTCKTLCTALATATKAKGPEVLCKKLKDANELKLSAFYKACDQPWVYANITAEEPLCCDNTNVKVCPSMAKANTTAVDSQVTTN